MESDSDNRVSDIHVWRIGSHHLSAIISIVTLYPKAPEYYKSLLAEYDEIAHVTVEVNGCGVEACSPRTERNG
jgi:Co/Zn/Cd efflux system component